MHAATPLDGAPARPFNRYLLHADAGAGATGAFGCGSCICALGSALVLGFQEAGVRVDGRPVTDLAAAAQLNQLLDDCSATIGLALLDSGALTTAALTSLATCDISAATLNCAELATPTQAAAQQPAAAAVASDAGSVAAGLAAAPDAAATTPSARAAAAATSGAWGITNRTPAVVLLWLVATAVVLLAC